VEKAGGEVKKDDAGDAKGSSSSLDTKSSLKTAAENVRKI
jgi:hypothetical protein